MPSSCSASSRVSGRFEALRGRADADVVDEHPHDALRLRIGPGGGGREQDLLLDLEVPRAVLAPEGEERLLGGRRVGVVARRSRCAATRAT